MRKDIIPQESPMALFIFASSQSIDDQNGSNRNFFINNAEKILVKTFKSNHINLIPLNKGLPYDDVFKKYESSYYINEFALSYYARENNCPYYIIVYYAYIGRLQITKRFIISGNPIYYETNGLALYDQFSLYGWLVESEKSQILSTSYRGFLSFQANKNQNMQYYSSNKITNIVHQYTNFINDATYEMFKNIYDDKTNRISPENSRDSLYN